MASTYSTRLKIELIGDGEQSGSWGTTTNSNFNQSLEQSIAGVLQVSTNGNATQTLTTGSGPQAQADNQSRQGGLIFISADQDCTVTFPGTEKLYFIRNANTAYKITLTDGSNTKVLQPNTNYFIAYDDAGAWHSVDSSGGTYVEKTSAYTAFAGDNIFVDTSAAAVTITLPASPTQGQSVSFIDSEGTFDTNNLTVEPGSEKIMAKTAGDEMVVATESAAFTLVYQDSTYGWRFKNL
tara:strand:+ start:305 stop:1018 length:714 start_codon:yes stop_codon:yes gene_type:complete